MAVLAALLRVAAARWPRQLAASTLTCPACVSVRQPCAVWRFICGDYHVQFFQVFAFGLVGLWPLPFMGAPPASPIGFGVLAHRAPAGLLRGPLRPRRLGAAPLALRLRRPASLCLPALAGAALAAHLPRRLKTYYKAHSMSLCNAGNNRASICKAIFMPSFL